MSSKFAFSAVIATLVALSAACTTVPDPVPEPEPEPPLPATVLEQLSADGLFAFGRADLEDFSPDGRAALDELADRLDGREVEFVHVVGHSDRIGSATGNHTISSKRANSVREYLIQRGIPEERITAVGRGSTEPVVECSDERGDALKDCLAPNRRVEVRVKFVE